ncbi:MAG: signal recognition particle-docking protein FtsY [Phycisphaerales bacterium]|nr:signal recognition particle-docking protein FtsY [Phycisphaerales bacterium]
MGLIGSALGKLKSGLSKTRTTFVSGLRSLVAGRTLDAALIDEIETLLLKADVGREATTKLIDGLREAVKAKQLAKGEDAVEYLKREIAAMWPERDRSIAKIANGPTVVLVTGVNGAGKTTSIAKLCKRLRDEGNTVLLAACDTFRAGAVRQLEIWAERLGVDVVKGQQGGDPAAVAFDGVQAAIAREVDYLIVDTAGRLQTQDPLMRQLTKVRNVLGKKIDGAPHEVLLVLDATAGQNALRQAESFLESAGVTGIVLAKLDGTAKGGVVVAIKHATDIPVKFVGTGETPDDMEVFDPETFVEAMFSE